MKSEELLEVIDVIEREAASIAVRELVNGRMGHFYLTELPAELAIKHVCNMLRTRIRTGLHEASR